MRLDYAAAAPEATKALAGVNAALLRAGLDKRLRDLLFLRVSQINGCSYCVDEHARDLRQAGEREYAPGRHISIYGTREGWRSVKRQLARIQRGA
jgi:AhpD family alkylhydroperoxidase